MTDQINEILTERGTRYGSFIQHSAIAQRMKRCVQDHSNWDFMTADKRQAIEVIIDKIARIVNGDPEYKDSWVDIQGYAKLAEDNCKEDGK